MSSWASLKCMKYASSSLEVDRTARNFMHMQRIRCSRRLIDMPSLKEMHMHKINILLCFTFRCAKWLDVWKIRDVERSTYRNIIQTFLASCSRVYRELSECCASKKNRSTCDMDMNFPVPKKMRKTHLIYVWFFEVMRLLFSHFATFLYPAGF